MDISRPSGNQNTINLNHAPTSNIQNSSDAPDFFQALLMSASPESSKQTNTEKHSSTCDQKSESKPEEDDSESNSISINQVDSTLLLSQLNFMAKIDNKVQPSTSDIQQQQTTDLSKVTPEFINLKPFTSQEPKSTFTEQAPIEKPAFNQLVTKTETDESNDAPPSPVTNNLMNNTIDIKKTLEKPTMLTTSQTVTLDKTAQTNFVMNTPVINNSHQTVKSITSNTRIKEPEVQQSKFADALHQVANLISTNMQNQPTNNNHEMLPNTLPTHKTNIEPGVTAEVQNHDITIEVLPQTIDSIVKEAYNAKIKIYPPELGQIEAKLKIDKNGTDLVILTENNQVKHIVETNLAQLRQHFQQADIILNTINIDTFQSQTKDHNQQNSQNNAQEMSKERTPNQNQQNISSKKPDKLESSIIDTYA